MKRNIIRTIVLVAMMIMVFGVTANAGVRDAKVRADFEKVYFSELLEGLEEGWKEAKEEEDIENYFKGYDCNYTEVGVNIYDITIVMHHVDGTDIEYHMFYDAVEEDVILDYVVIEGERFTVEDAAEIYPEVM